MGHNDFFTPVAVELQAVENNLATNIDTKLGVLNDASIHLLKAGGKRLRPAFALLAAKIYRENLEEVVSLAVALELIHMATLVHDDVIDNSETRRGTDTVKRQWGNRMSIYAGNYIFARALALISDYHRSDVVDILADASMKICEGEIIQMLSAYNVKVGLKNYLRRIERKTALLISVSCHLGALMVNAPPAEVLALKRYGYYLGMAFQVTDDILDFVADEEVLGKPVGSDVKQGVITLPAIYALKFDPRREELAGLLSSPDYCASEAERILEIICESGGIEYAYEVTQYYALKARRQLNYLPDVQVKTTLSNLAEFISVREY